MSRRVSSSPARILQEFHSPFEPIDTCFKSFVRRRHLLRRAPARKPDAGGGIEEVRGVCHSGFAKGDDDSIVGCGESMCELRYLPGIETGL